MLAKLHAALEASHQSFSVAQEPIVSVVRGRSFETFASPFVAGNVLSSLATLRMTGLQPSTEKYVEYLLQTKEKQGIWRMSQDYRAVYPPDADCTACALAALHQWGISSVDYSRALASLANQSGSKGGVPTWIVSTPNAAPAKRNEVDVVVNANVLWCATIIGVDLPWVRSFVSEFLSTRGLDCSTSPYYSSPYLFSYFLGRWIAAEDKERVGSQRALVARETMTLTKREGLAALDLALGTCCLLNLDEIGNDSGDASHLMKIAETLIDLRLKSGLWPSEALFVDPGGGVYYSEAMTNAICLEALARVLFTLENLSTT